MVQNVLSKLMLTNVCGMFKLMLMKSYLEGVCVFVVLYGNVFRTLYVVYCVCDSWKMFIVNYDCGMPNENSFETYYGDVS